MPPALMGGLRWTIAGALLALYVVSRGERLPPRAQWGSIVLLGFLLLGLGNGGVVVAEQWLPSGLAAVLVATSPFWMATVEACVPDGERLHPPVVIGLLVGFSGIVLLVWPELTLGGGDRHFLLGASLPCRSRRSAGRSVPPTRGGTRAPRTCSARQPSRCSRVD